MQISTEDRRSIIALACRIAWADGVVADSERAYVRSLVARVAADAIGEEELETWLASPATAPEVERLPPGVDDFFVYEALRLLEVDGEIDDAEVDALHDIVKRLFNSRPTGTPLARIALAKREV